MDHRQQPVRNRDSKADTVDRRTILARSVRALTMSIFGGLAGNAVTHAQAPSAASPSPAAQPPETAGDRIRRVVSGLNAQNRSYVVSDDMVRPNDVWKT